MRDLGDEHSPDGDDSGADAVPEHGDDARQPRYEVVNDAAARKARALEYRQQVEARYAAYDAGNARPQDAQVSRVAAESTTGPVDGTAAWDGRARHERLEATEADGSEHAGRETQPLPGPDSSEDASPSGEPADSWPPFSADQDRVRQLYREYLADMTSTDRQSGRDQGMNTVGPKPDQSPGEISGLPPSGDELAEMESSKKSRFSDLFREAEKEENLDGLHDAAEEYASTVQRWLSARPPEGHAQQSVPAHHPYITPWVPEHGIEGADAVSAVMVAGILTAHMARWIDDKLTHRRGGHDDSNR
jgi:hypothetical protein